MSEQIKPTDPDDEARSSLAGRVLVVTGLSGAGRSTALKALEDMNCEAVDNLPIRLMPSLIQQGSAAGRGLAIGVDVRTRDFAADVFAQQIEELRSQVSCRIDLVFLDCANEVIARRYTETRRVHPMASDRPLSDGIAAERRLLSPLLDGADVVIDTSLTNIHEFGRLLRDRLVGVPVGEANVLVTSFSYRHGVPRDADLVIDVRFLRNPHYDRDLRAKTGRDPDVGAFITEDPDFEEFFSCLTNLLALLLPRFNEEGKSYLTIAIGCTGGQHRSVYVAEELRNWLAERATQVDVRHRELSFDTEKSGDER
ncbi:MAG: RNase adapter RapZ [Alphaproteobacteria bacterium]|nr:RNase adapter RapZ [Alphaproteobacteria bacterium]